MEKRIIHFFRKFLAKTPFHPQWIVFRNNYESIGNLGMYLKGKVLDIGCGQSEVKNYLSQDVEYIGLDYYYTSVDWYHSSPDIYANATQIPMANGSMDAVLLLDVLEHIPDSDKCLDEISRVLRKQGTFLLQVPFIYPIHDSPLDFKRWTIFGLENTLEKHGFNIVKFYSQGQPFDTSMLMFNLSLGKILLNSIKKKNPLMILIPVYPIIVFICNIVALLGSIVSPKDDFMPWGYRVIAIKK